MKARRKAHRKQTKPHDQETNRRLKNWARTRLIPCKADQPSPYRPAERLTGDALLDFESWVVKVGNIGPGAAEPSIPVLAFKTGLSEKTVGRCLDVLCDGDPKRNLKPLFIRERVRRGRRGGGGYVYRIVRDPDALLAARTRYPDHVRLLKRVILGTATVTGSLELPPELEAQAQDMRRDRLRIDQDLLAGRVKPEEAQLKRRKLDQRVEKLARGWGRDTYAELHGADPPKRRGKGVKAPEAAEVVPIRDADPLEVKGGEVFTGGLCADPHRLDAESGTWGDDYNPDDDPELR